MCVGLIVSTVGYSTTRALRAYWQQVSTGCWKLYTLFCQSDALYFFLHCHKQQYRYITVGAKAACTAYLSGLGCRVFVHSLEDDKLLKYVLKPVDLVEWLVIILQVGMMKLWFVQEIYWVDVFVTCNKAISEPLSHLLSTSHHHHGKQLKYPQHHRTMHNQLATPGSNKNTHAATAHHSTRSSHTFKNLAATGSLYKPKINTATVLQHNQLTAAAVYKKWTCCRHC